MRCWPQVICPRRTTDHQAVQDEAGWGGGYEGFGLKRSVFVNGIPGTLQWNGSWFLRTYVFFGNVRYALRLHSVFPPLRCVELESRSSKWKERGHTARSCRVVKKRQTRQKCNSPSFPRIYLSSRNASTHSSGETMTQTVQPHPFAAHCGINAWASLLLPGTVCSRYGPVTLELKALATTGWVCCKVPFLLLQVP